MFQVLFALNEMRPSVKIKRLAEKFAAAQAGMKLRRKVLFELHQLQKPEYKIPESLKTPNTCAG